jgi:hypothetical protein
MMPYNLPCMVGPREMYFWGSTYIESMMSPIKIIPIVEFKSGSGLALSRYKCEDMTHSYPLPRATRSQDVTREWVRWGIVRSNFRIE